MPQLEINFMFFRVDHSPLDNDFIFKKRREIAQMFENCGFGEIVENGENKFANTFAIPITDEYFEPENDLYIAYSLVIPCLHGEMQQLLMNGIPELYRDVNNIDLPFRLVTHVIYT